MSNITDAQDEARATGRQVPIQGTNGMVAYPNGYVGTPSGGGISGTRAATLTKPVVVNPSRPVVAQPVSGTLARSMLTPPVVAQPVAPSAPFSAAGVQGLPGSPSGPAVAAPRIQPPMNQANPNTTYVSPNTPQPATAAPVVGQTGTQSGQPATPDLVVTAQRYRLQHGLATSDDTDALNAESLAAAQAGRTSFNPTLAAQYGQPLAAGVYGPRTDVVNALTLPTTATQVQPQATQVAQNLLQQGTY